MIHRSKVWDVAVLALAAIVFSLGVNWGLPSSENDAYLFHGRPAWSGERILELAGRTDDPERGADVASHSGVDRGLAVVLNETDAERARIVRRYRLMSYQPDEWNTLKALSEMQPGRGNFDPKLYQYGGLWVYPVGAGLKIASLLRLVDLRPDMAWHLDHPDAFGRFYVVARLYSAAWGVIGAAAIFILVRRITADARLSTIAAAAFIFMPAVINAAHEAKPHLAGAVLILLAVLAGSIYVERGRTRHWVLAAVLCGAAVGMVLSTLPVMLILPGMAMLRRQAWRERARVVLMGAVIATAVYAITNPYVPLNLIRHRAVLVSNLGNSREMYHAHLTGEGVANTLYLIAAATSPTLAAAGVLGAAALGLRALFARGRAEPAEIRRRATGLLLAIPSLAVLGQCVAFAAGKPAEFGRFTLQTDLFLLVEAFVAIATFAHCPVRRVVYSVLLLATSTLPGLFYEAGFIRDNSALSSRRVEAERLAVTRRPGNASLAVLAEPAPYCLPPVDLFGRRIILLPKGVSAEYDFRVAATSIRAVDVPEGENRWLSLFTTTPISWANKTFIIRRRD